jgi:hypothetical protein
VEAPKKAYVVMDSHGAPCFSADTFERAAERVVAVLKGQATDGTIGRPQIAYYIVEVEGE